MIDERKGGNRKDNPSRYHKIRKIVSNNECGDVYGITIPRDIAVKFIDCKVCIQTSGLGILITRGVQL
jgi:hypothetical protein